MKTWQFWVVILLIIFIIVPLIIYAVSVNAAAKVVATNPNMNQGIDLNGYPSFAPPKNTITN